ncbi:hypothetical protein CAPN006_14340 [Capnocytophaga canimorsus]|uniref:hypothetical protein n=1 Tax=Capnocytophaga canimorsus TaxID=28188 RepID=UPI001AD1DEBB|nr:hypothetical protein [Capnocytophaga canimorsus]GIM57041.1 hypothetical protein CAPN006_14340 [Capnocytophaga canimorsus]
MTEREKLLMKFIHHYQEIAEKLGKKNLLVGEHKTQFIGLYEKLEIKFNTKEVKQITNIDEQKMFRLKTSGCCNVSLSKNCLKLYPNQLALYEQDMLRKLLTNENFSHLPWSYIHAYAQREGLLTMSLDTFYKYGKDLGFKPQKKEKKSKMKMFCPKATYPFQILHMDSTFWRCENGERIHIHFIQDNFSKKILGAIVDYSIKSETVVKNLSNVIEENQLQQKTLELYCDDGPENKREVEAYLAANNFVLKKITANYKTKKSNNEIEAWNKKFKHILLRKYSIKSMLHMRKLIPEMLDYYNNLYLPSLESLTPNEVVAGKTRKTIEQEIRVKQNLIRRLEANRNLDCLLKEAQDFQKYDCKSVLKSNKNL